MNLTIIAATLALSASALAQSNLVVQTGTTFVYDTSNGVLLVADLTIQPGGVLRARGQDFFHLRATGTVQIDGLLELSGFDDPGVNALAWSGPSRGAPGGPGGGQGGQATH